MNGRGVPSARRYCGRHALARSRRAPVKREPSDRNRLFAHFVACRGANVGVGGRLPAKPIPCIPGTAIRMVLRHVDSTCSEATCRPDEPGHWETLASGITYETTFLSPPSRQPSLRHSHADLTGHHPPATAPKPRAEQHSRYLSLMENTSGVVHYRQLLRNLGLAPPADSFARQLT